MQQLLHNGWMRGSLGILLMLFGIGGFIAGMVGHTNLPLRYLIGGIVLMLVGVGNLITARTLLQQQAR